MEENTRNVPIETLRSFVEELFAAGGMKPDEAAWFAETIVQANLWGIDSHGVIRVPTYFKRILNGAINANANLHVIRKAPAVSLVDADGAAGVVAGKLAMEQAIADAKTHGVGVCGVKRSVGGRSAPPRQQRLLYGGVLLANAVPDGARRRRIYF